MAKKMVIWFPPLLLQSFWEVLYIMFQLIIFYTENEEFENA